MCSSVDNEVSFSFHANYLAYLFEVSHEGFDLYFKEKYSVQIGEVIYDDIVSFIGGDVGTTLINSLLF